MQASDWLSQQTCGQLAVEPTLDVDMLLLLKLTTEDSFSYLIFILIYLI